MTGDVGILRRGRQIAAYSFLLACRPLSKLSEAFPRANINSDAAAWSDKSVPQSEGASWLGRASSVPFKSAWQIAVCYTNEGSVREIYRQRGTKGPAKPRDIERRK